MDKTCGTCRFCGPRNPDQPEELRNLALVCRIRAPGPHGFIVVNRYDWCGEHQDKEPTR